VFLKKALVSSAIWSHTNLPLLLVPILQKKTSTSKVEEIKRAIAQHIMVLQSISWSFSSKILSLNRPLPSLTNATLRMTLMAITNKDGKKLFLLVDLNWNGQGFIVAYPMLYATQASDFVEHLPAYLAHSHGEEIYRWFTPDAVTEAKAMGWDSEKQQPISPDGLALRNTLQSLELDWCITTADPSTPPAAGVDLDNITLPSFNTLTQQLLTQPGAPSVAPSNVIHAAPQQVIEIHDDITMASTVDTRLTALERTCALLPLIMKKLEALSPPPNTPADGSTSTQAAQATPSVQGSASGGTD